MVNNNELCIWMCLVVQSVSPSVRQPDRQSDERRHSRSSVMMNYCSLAAQATSTTEGLKCLHSFIANFAKVPSVSQSEGKGPQKVCFNAPRKCWVSTMWFDLKWGWWVVGQSRKKKNSSCWCQMSLNFKSNCWFPNWIEVDYTLNGIETDCEKWFFFLYAKHFRSAILQDS